MINIIHRVFGSTWQRGHGIGLHIADDAVRLATVHLASHHLVAIAERRLPTGTVVRLAPRLAPELAESFAGLGADLGLTARHSVTVAVDCSVSLAGVGSPDPGMTRVDVVDDDVVGSAAIATHRLDQLARAASGAFRIVCVEPSALGLARLIAPGDDDRHPVSSHAAEWGSTMLVYAAGHSIEARFQGGKADGLGMWAGETPGELSRTGPVGRLTCPRWLAESPLAERLYRFAPAAGAALASGSPLDGNFLDARAVSTPAEGNKAAGWVVERVAETWWTEPNTTVAANPE